MALTAPRLPSSTCLGFDASPPLLITSRVFILKKINADAIDDAAHNTRQPMADYVEDWLKNQCVAARVRAFKPFNPTHSFACLTAASTTCMAAALLSPPPCPCISSSFPVCDCRRDAVAGMARGK